MKLTMTTRIVPAAFVRRLLGCALAILAVSPTGVRAQQPAGEFPKIQLTAGRSTILTTDFDVTRVAVTDPAIADFSTVEPREILIDGKAPGTVSLIVWGAGQRRQYDVIVEPGVSTLEQRLQAL